jgi:type VI protein secretion system component VasF
MNSALAQTIQIALGPVFLLVAVGGLLTVIAGRLARVVDRSRDLMDRYENTDGSAHARLVRELRIVDRRMGIINWSIALCVACGIVVCLMVAMLFLAGSGQHDLALPISASFILAMLLLLGALILFLIEVRLAIRTIHVPAEMLEK